MNTATKKNYVEKVLRWTLYVVFVAYCLSLLVPLFWMLFTSTKTYIEYYENTFLWPKKWTFENFPSAMTKIKIDVIKDRKIIRYDIWDMVSTSFVWAFCTSLLSTAMTACVAYVLAKYKFAGSDFLYMLGIFVMVTPIIGSTPSMMVVRRSLKIYNNMFMTILTQNSTTFSGLNFMILYAAFKSLPSSFSEAAKIDGAGDWAIMLKIMLPMALPTCAVIFVLAFISHWNEYNVFLVWLPAYANLAYGMYKFQNDATTYGATINEVMAGFVIACIPSMTLYLCSQKLITSNLTVGGLKG